MFDDDDSVFAAMRAGARGYVLKGAQQDEIVRAIHAVAAGEAIFGPGIARRVLGLIASGTRNAEIARRMSIAPETVANHVSAIFARSNDPATTGNRATGRKGATSRLSSPRRDEWGESGSHESRRKRSFERKADEIGRAGPGFAA